jgi:hypothetical protein
MKPTAASRRRPPGRPARIRRALGAAVGAALVAGGCAAPAPRDLPYQAPDGGPEAQLTVKTERMWLPNRVTLFLVRPGADPSAGTRQVVGQLQSGEGVRKEVLSLDARLPAGVPLPLYFEYRYDVGSLSENGCNYAVTPTLDAGARYLVDFIKDTRGCQPRFFLIGKDGRPTEIPAPR